MKTITLSRLRVLAVAVADAEEGSHEWDAATDALSAKFSPRQLVALIDKLQATQYERNDAFAELKRRDKASPVAWLIEGDSFPAHLSSNTEYAHQYPDRKVTPLYFEVPAAVLPDKLHESAYKAGLTAGWNFGIENNAAGFSRSLAAHSCVKGE